MGSYRVALTASAEKELQKLPGTYITRVVTRLEALSVNPRPPGCKKLVGGRTEWRIRVGNYRVLPILLVPLFEMLSLFTIDLTCS